MNRFFFNKTSQQKAKMNRFTVLESRNRLSTNANLGLQRVGRFFNIAGTSAGSKGRLLINYTLYGDSGTATVGRYQNSGKFKYVRLYVCLSVCTWWDDIKNVTASHWKYCVYDIRDDWGNCCSGDNSEKFMNHLQSMPSKMSCEEWLYHVSPKMLKVIPC